MGYKFPRYTQQTGTTEVGQVSPVAATQSQDVPQGLVQVATGIDNLGSALHGAAVDSANEKIKEQYDKDLAWVANVGNQFTLQTMQNFEKYKETADPSGSGFYENWHKTLYDSHEKLIQSANSDQQRKLLTQHTNQTLLGFAEKGFTYETQLSDHYKLTNVNNAVETGAQIAAGDFSQTNPQIANALQVIKQTIKDPLKAAEASKNAIETITTAGYMSRIDNGDANGVIEEFKADAKSFNTPEKKAIYNHATANGVDPVTMSFIISQESGFNNGAKNGDSTAKGIGQVTDGAWKQVMGDKPRTGDLEDEAEAATLYAKYLSNILRPKLGREPTAVELRTAYHLGDGGFKKMLAAGKDAKIEDVLPNIIPKNQHLKGKTLDSYLQEQTTAYNKHQSQYHKEHPVPFMTWDMRNKIQHKATQAVEQQNAQLAVELKQLASDHEAMALDGNMSFKPLTYSDFGKMYRNPQMADRAYQDYAANLQWGKDVSMVNQLNPQQEQDILAAHNPNNERGYAGDVKRREQLQKVIDAKHKAIQDDPVAWVLKNDPTIKGDTDIEGIIAAQTKQGVAYPQVLSKSQLDNLKTDMTKLKGENKANYLTQLATKYGKNFGLVARQLQLDSKAPKGIAAILAAPTDYAMKQAATVADVELETLKNSLPKKYTAKDIDDKIQAQLAPFYNSHGLSQMDSPAMKDIGETITKLTYDYVRSGSTPKDAAERAVNLFVGTDKYSYLDNKATNYTVRVPKQYDSKIINNALQNYTSALTDKELDTSKVTVKNLWNMKKDSNGYLDLVKKNSFWLTNANETGVGMYFLGADNKPYPLLDKNGKHITQSFNQLTVGAHQKQVIHDQQQAQHIASTAQILMGVNK